MSIEPGHDQPAEPPRPAQPASDFVPRTMNPLAVVSIVGAVLGVIGLMPVVGSLVGVICGRIAQRQIAERDQDGGGIARAAVIVGWIGLGLALLVFLFVFVLIALASAPGTS